MGVVYGFGNGDCEIVMVFCGLMVCLAGWIGCLAGNGIGSGEEGSCCLFETLWVLYSIGVMVSNVSCEGNGVGLGFEV